MGYNISPETIRGYFTPPKIEEFIDKTFDWDRQEHSCSPNGMMYDKHQRGIIPIEIERIFLQRKAAKGKEFAANDVSTRAKLILERRKRS